MLDMLHSGGVVPLFVTVSRFSRVARSGTVTTGPAVAICIPQNRLEDIARQIDLLVRGSNAESL
jgi:hypothetical protein